MKKIFISRQLEDESVFHKTLTTNGLLVHGESLVSLRAVPFDDPPPYDWAFFYSQNAARFFVENVSPEVLSKLKLAALGPGTAAVLTALGHPPQFVGDGEPDRTAWHFMGAAKGQRVLFPRASDSRRSVQTFLGEECTVLDLVVYENTPRTDFKLPSFDVLTFTSPLNVQAFFAKKTWQGEHVVAIGNTTAKALANLGIMGVVVAKTPSEEALAAAVLLAIG